MLLGKLICLRYILPFSMIYANPKLCRWSWMTSSLSLAAPKPSVFSTSGITQSTPPSCKTTLEGCPPFMAQVLSCGHTTFHLYLATVDGFPSGSFKIERSWACLQEGVKGSVDLENELVRIGQDTLLKEKAVNYVSIP